MPSPLEGSPETELPDLTDHSSNTDRSQQPAIGLLAMARAAQAAVQVERETQTSLTDKRTPSMGTGIERNESGTLSPGSWDMRQSRVSDSEPKPEWPRRRAQHLSIGTIIAEHINNVLPTHLIYVPESKVLGRAAMQKSVQATIEKKVHDARNAGGVPENPKEYSYVVTDFVNDALAYAIFSHRWLDDGEPTFQDVTKPSRRRRLFAAGGAGLLKLSSFCAVAHAQGFDWAWSDTCCIDKTSSAELDEAIRSMFRWYRNAKLCIVHLADSLSREDMARDAWFTRGWTLQELLAPRRMKFYNKHWEPLTEGYDDKDTVPEGGLREILSDITEIPDREIKYFSASVDNFQQKMFWASKRRTTRVEDTAYSLIGIFNVSLMTAYGEGERAFYRLQVAIMEKTNTIDLFVWNGFCSYDHSLMARSPECFADPDLHVPRLLPWNIYVDDAGKQRMFQLGGFPARGGTSFTLTNVGLRIDLVLFDIYTDTPPPDSDFECRWKPGEFRADCIVWQPEYDDGRLPSPDETFTAYRTPDGPRSGPNSNLAFGLRPYTLGILDYEWGEANGQPGFLLDSLSRVSNARVDGCHRQTPLEYGLEDLRQLVVTTMKDCLYTAVILQDSGKPVAERRRLVRVANSAILRVRRPENGWGARAETVFML
ncbi:hypothetical protein B0H21DRAFT_824404 [Amylocystis lapponica]|nr:hypothetical protein B0H21DRAFT_824404 [Amylocystis lapponica]